VTVDDGAGIRAGQQHWTTVVAANPDRQDRSHVSIITGYLVRHVSANSSKRAWAASMVGAV